MFRTPVNQQNQPQPSKNGEHGENDETVETLKMENRMYNLLLFIFREMARNCRKALSTTLIKRYVNGRRIVLSIPI